MDKRGNGCKLGSESLGEKGDILLRSVARGFTVFFFISSGNPNPQPPLFPSMAADPEPCPPGGERGKSDRRGHRQNTDDDLVGTGAGKTRPPGGDSQPGL